MHSLLTALQQTKKIDWPCLKFLMIGDKKIIDVSDLNFTIEWGEHMTLAQSIAHVYKHLDKNVDVLVISSLVNDFCQATPHEFAPNGHKYLKFVEMNQLNSLIHLMELHTSKWKRVYPKLLIYWLLPYPPDFLRYYKKSLDLNGMEWKTSLEIIEKFNLMSKNFFQTINKLRQLIEKTNLDVMDLNKSFFQSTGYEKSFLLTSSDRPKWPGSFTLDGFTCSASFSREFAHYFKEILLESKKSYLDDIISSKRKGKNKDHQAPTSVQSFPSDAIASTSKLPQLSFSQTLTQNLDADVQEALQKIKKAKAGLDGKHSFDMPSIFSEYIRKLSSSLWKDLLIYSKDEARTAMGVLEEVIEAITNPSYPFKSNGCKVIFITDSEHLVYKFEELYSTREKIGFNDDIKSAFPLVMADLPVNVGLRMGQKAYRNLANLNAVITFKTGKCSTSSTFNTSLKQLMKFIYKKKSSSKICRIRVCGSGTKHEDNQINADFFPNPFILLEEDAPSTNCEPDQLKPLTNTQSYKTSDKSAPLLEPLSSPQVFVPPMPEGDSLAKQLGTISQMLSLENKKEDPSSALKTMKNVQHSASNKFLSSMPKIAQTELSTDDVKSMPFDEFLECAGPDLAEKYKMEAKQLEIDLQANYDIYTEVPDLHSLYEDKFSEFIKKFSQVFTPSDDPKSDPLWENFWKMSMQQVQDKEFEDQLKDLKEDFRKRFLSIQQGLYSQNKSPELEILQDAYYKFPIKTAEQYSKKEIQPIIFAKSLESFNREIQPVSYEKTSENITQPISYEKKSDHNHDLRKSAQIDSSIKRVKKAPSIEINKVSDAESTPLSETSNTKSSSGLTLDAFLQIYQRNKPAPPQSETTKKDLLFSNDLIINYNDPSKYYEEIFSGYKDSKRRSPELEQRSKKKKQSRSRSPIHSKNSKAKSSDKSRTTRKHRSRSPSLKRSKRRSRSPSPKNSRRRSRTPSARRRSRDPSPKNSRNRSAKYISSKSPSSSPDYTKSRPFMPLKSPSRSPIRPSDASLPKSDISSLGHLLSLKKKPNIEQDEVAPIYSISKTIQLLEKACDEVGTIGMALKAIIQQIKVHEPKKMLEFFNDVENKMLAKMTVAKLESLNTTGQDSQRHERTVSWTLRLLEQAEKFGNITKKISEKKNGMMPSTTSALTSTTFTFNSHSHVTPLPAPAPVSPTPTLASNCNLFDSFDIDALAKATFGSDTISTNQFIKSTCIYKGLPTPSDEELHILFQKVSAKHFKMAMS